jgi:hypothetical protein
VPVNRPMALVRSLTVRKVPRRMAWRVMMAKKIPAMFSHEQPVGVECRVTRGLSASQLRHAENPRLIRNAYGTPELCIS